LIAKLRPSAALVAAVLQIIGMVAIAHGVTLLLGLGAGLVVAGVEALIVGVAVEKEASNARKPPA